MTVDERLTGGRVALAQHLAGDLDEVGLQIALVPGGEDIGDRVDVVAADPPQQVVGLADELHVGVLDPVVDHLHEVPRAVRADVRHARLPVDAGGDRREDRAERRVGLGRAAGHDRRPEQGALLAAGDADADEAQAALAQRLLAADRVLEVRVAAVDDDVALVEAVRELVDDRVGARAGLHHHDRRARPGERCDEAVEVLARDEPGLGMVLHQLSRALGRPVEHRDGVALASREVAGEVRAHHGQPDDSDVRGAGLHRAHLALLAARVRVR
jgi:hypothetical protein